MLLAVLIALVVGAAVGAVMTSRSRSEAVGSPAPEPAPVATPAPPAEHDDVGMVLRSAVDQLELGVVISDADGTVMYRNEAASKMLGTHAGLIVDQHIEEALDAARQKLRVDEIVELNGPPRSYFLLLAESMPNGYAVATVNDVSERHRSDLMRTDFIANISHELKTPVGAIAVLSEALEGETDPAVVDRVSSRLVDEAHRAVRSIDDLLELTTIESGPSSDDLIELDAVIADAIARGRVADEGRGVTVTALDSSSPVSMRGDRRQLLSALGNLVENAVKYSDDGGTVQVRTRCDDRTIEVMVADDGVGIPQRDLDRIFERFYRVDRARSRHTGGTGLGLSIVRNVATNHGGEVLVSSQEGEGSTFVLRLPATLLVDDPPAAVTDASIDQGGVEAIETAEMATDIAAEREGMRRE